MFASPRLPALMAMDMPGFLSCRAHQSAWHSPPATGGARGRRSVRSRQRSDGNHAASCERRRSYSFRPALYIHVRGFILRFSPFHSFTLSPAPNRAIAREFLMLLRHAKRFGFALASSRRRWRGCVRRSLGPKLSRSARRRLTVPQV